MFKHAIKRDVVIAYIYLFISIIFGFITAPLIVRNVGMADYGLMNLILSVTSYASLFQFGLGNTVVRYTAKAVKENNQKDEHEVVTFALIFYSISAMLILMLGIIIYFNFNNIFNITNEQIGIGKLMYLISLLNSVLNIPLMVFYSYMKGHNKFFLFNCSLILKTLIRFTLLIIIFRVHIGIVGVMVIDLVLSQLMNLFNIIYSFKKLKLKVTYSKFNKTYIKGVFGFSIFVFITQIVDMIYWKTDHILLGIYDTTENIAVYTVSQTIISYFRIFATTLTSVLLPTLTKLALEKDNIYLLNNVFMKTGRILGKLVMPIVVCFIFLGDEFIVLWMGESFSEAYKYTLIIMIPLGIDLISVVGINILYAMNKHKFRAITLLVSSILNIVLSIVLIKKVGIIGVSIATAIVLVVGNILVLGIYYVKLLKINILSYVKESVFTNIVCLIPTILFLLICNLVIIKDSFISFVVKGCISVLLYLTSQYFLGLDTNEKNIFKNKIRSFKNLFMK